MLRLDCVTKVYRTGRREVRALDGCSLAVAAGEFAAVQGPSGCGKTTLLLAAGGLLQPDAGRVVICGRDPYALASDARARLRAECVGFVFQQFHLIPYLNVLDNVLAASLAQPSAEAAGRARRLIEQVGLADRADHVPAALSTGERQRVALARAMLNQPRIILADEPTGNLDPASGKVVLEHLASFARGGGAVLLVTHDPSAAKYADRVWQMDAGHIVGQAIA